MATLSLQSFTTLVSNMAASAQGATTAAINVTVGSVTRALIEATASTALWVQYLVLQVLAITRLITSSGIDVDTFVGDFGLTRLPGVASTVSLTLSSFSPATQSGVIEPTTAVGRTFDGLFTFQAYEDTTNAYWNASAGGYIRPAGVSAIPVPCVCTIVGSAGNVAAGAVNLLASAIAGIDTVTNANSATGGVDAETDAALKSRFALYINSRSGATLQAVEAAIEGVQQGLIYTVLEDSDAAGDFRPGFFAVLVDDGSGHPSATLLAAIYAAVNAIRPIGVSFSVTAPAFIYAPVTGTLTVASTASNSAAVSAANRAVEAYLSALAIGATASYLQLGSDVLLAGSGITGVSTLTLNGVAANLVPTAIQAIRAGTITFTATGGTP